jgi:hypothetical protein
MTGEKTKVFGLNLMKVEDDIIDLGDGRKIKVSFCELANAINIARWIYR